jgi:hypothetical protein
MAATLTHERFIGGEWIFERKSDGIDLGRHGRAGSRLHRDPPGRRHAVEPSKKLLELIKDYVLLVDSLSSTDLCKHGPLN